MEVETRRSFFGKIAAMAALITGAPKLFGQQTPPSVGSPASGGAPAAGVPGGDGPRRAGGSSHTHNGIYYFSGTGSNDGYPKDDHILVTDPFEKHVTATHDGCSEEISGASWLHHGQHHQSPGFPLPASRRWHSYVYGQSAVRRA